MDFKPLVSVIMPAYNAQQYIAEAIESVIAQTYSNWELIIVNDGSTDDTLNIISHYQQQDSRIKIIDQLNRRLGAARNAALRVAKGDYIAFLDSDDCWTVDKISQQIQQMLLNPNVDISFTHGYIIKDDKIVDPNPLFAGIKSGFEVYNAEYIHNEIVISSVLMTKDVLLKCGFQELDEKFFGCEDLDYWLRAARNGLIFNGINQKLYFYRLHENNMSANYLEMIFSQAGVLLKNYDQSLLSAGVRTKVFQPFIMYVFFRLLRAGKWAESGYIYTQAAKAIKPFWLASLLYLFKRTYYRTQKLFHKTISKFA